MSAPATQDTTSTSLPVVACERCDNQVQAVGLSHEQLLAALDTQIRIEADGLRNEGWTRWAIWGAIAALVWVATDLWKSVEGSGVQIAVLALVLFVFRKFVEEGLRLLSPHSRMDVGPARFRSMADTIHPLRTEIAVETLQYLLILGVLAYFAIPRQQFLWAYALSGLVMGFFMLGSGMWSIGLPTRLNLRTTFNLLTVVQLTWLGAAGWQLVALLWSESGHYSMVDFRLALVLNAGIFLISRLVTATSSEYLLTRLTHLRQAIAFGRIAIKEAKELTETLLAGVSLAAVLKPFGDTIRKEIATMKSLLADANQLLDRAHGKIAQPDQNFQEVLRDLDGMEDGILKKINHQINRVKQAWNRYFIQYSIVITYSREIRPEGRVAAEDTRALLAETNVILNECLQRYHSLKLEAAKACQASQRFQGAEALKSTGRDGTSGQSL